MSMTPAAHAEALSLFKPYPTPSVEEREVTFELEGVFDGASAWDLRRAIESLDEGAEQVVVDFSRVREFYDFGVAVLAHALADRDFERPKVALRGLRTHQARLFRYFGVTA